MHSVTSRQWFGLCCCVFIRETFFPGESGIVGDEQWWIYGKLPRCCVQKKFRRVWCENYGRQKRNVVFE